MNYIYNPGNGELYHYGVKGMKWGVRRYQNKDGSLTPAGKKRQAKQTKKSDRYIKRKLSYMNEKYAKRELDDAGREYARLSGRDGRDYYRNWLADDPNDPYTDYNYEQERQYAREKYVSAMAEHKTIQKYFSEPVSKIDTSNISYKEAKRLVNQYENEYIHEYLKAVKELDATVK